MDAALFSETPVNVYQTPPENSKLNTLTSNFHCQVKIIQTANRYVCIGLYVTRLYFVKEKY
jgi:hypothetical protein